MIHRYNLITDEIFQLSIREDEDSELESQIFLWRTHNPGTDEEFTELEAELKCSYECAERIVEGLNRMHEDEAIAMQIRRSRAKRSRRPSSGSPATRQAIRLELAAAGLGCAAGQRIG
jgi:hypothetical protein